MGGRLWCREHFGGSLDWEVRREDVIQQISGLPEFVRATSRQRVFSDLPTAYPKWEPYIRDLCGLAEFGLIHNDKKIFVKYFSLAVLAWGLREASHG